MAAVILSGSRKPIMFFAIDLFGNTINIEKLMVRLKRYMR